MQPMITKLTVYGRTDVGRVRATNEDAFFVADLASPTPVQSIEETLSLEVKDRGALLAVSDGMGGAQAGEVASAIVLHSLVQGMRSANATGAAEALRICVKEANQAVWKAANETPGHEGMGATLTAVLFHAGYAYAAEVGDSRAYVLRGSRMLQVTHDQSLVQELVDAGALTTQQANHSDKKGIILQSMGTSPGVHVVMTRFPLRRGDRFLLCSDGLTGKVKDEELRRVIWSTESLEQACSKLIEMALDRGGEDNITVILAEVSGEAVPELTDAESVSPEIVTEFVTT